jgi:hypothetical protein
VQPCEHLARGTAFLLLAALTGARPGIAEQVCDGTRATHSASRFEDNGDGTVTDRQSGLVWKRCSEGQAWDGGTCTGGASTYAWQQALQLADTASYAGKDDWRLPELKELASIVERACHSPAIDQWVFPATPSAWYWSSRSVTSCSGGAWGVSFEYGDAGSDDEGSANHVRLVRSGP